MTNLCALYTKHCLGTGDVIALCLESNIQTCYLYQTHENSKLKKSGVTMLLSDKMDSR